MVPRFGCQQCLVPAGHSGDDLPGDGVRLHGQRQVFFKNTFRTILYLPTHQRSSDLSHLVHLVQSPQRPDQRDAAQPGDSKSTSMAN